MKSILAMFMTLAAATLPGPAPAMAQEAVVTLRATVTGNQEQPKVMYILPWQQPGATEFEYRPGVALAEELYREIDREEFVRELDYREMLAAPAGGIDDGEQQ